MEHGHKCSCSIGPFQIIQCTESADIQEGVICDVSPARPLVWLGRALTLRPRVRSSQGLPLQHTPCPIRRFYSSVPREVTSEIKGTGVGGWGGLLAFFTPNNSRKTVDYASSEGRSIVPTRVIDSLRWPTSPLLSAKSGSKRLFLPYRTQPSPG